MTSLSHSCAVTLGAPGHTLLLDTDQENQKKASVSLRRKGGKDTSFMEYLIMKYNELPKMGTDLQLHPSLTTELITSCRKAQVSEAKCAL